MSNLSNSALGRYLSCGENYRLHYIERIRPTVHSAALAFGSAIDAALNELLVPTGANAEEIFERTFTTTKINGTEIYVPTYSQVVYANADYDNDLLTQSDYLFIEEEVKVGHVERHTDYLEAYNALKKRKTDSGFDSLKTIERSLYNLMNWLCLRQKGRLMLTAYRKKVLPKIERVHAVQKYVSLSNGAGGKITGYVDLIADIKGVGTVVLDNKTASMEYDEDAVLTSGQLALYVHILEEEYKTRKAGYIVMRKSIIKNRKKTCTKCGHDGSGKSHKTCDALVEGKRCHGEWSETIDPDVYVQFIWDEIPEQTERIVMENYDIANDAIAGGHFTRNFNTCNNYYGSKCPYINLCYRGKRDGLEKV